MGKVIKNCLVTGTDADVLKEYCIDRTNPLYSLYKGFNTSVNLSASDVYAAYAGTVMMITGNARTNYEVVVMCNVNQAVKYGNLKLVEVHKGQAVDVVTKIGSARGFVKVEYLTTYVKNPYSFRMNNIQMYKDDPMKILQPGSSVIQSASYQYSNSGLRDVVSALDGGGYDVIFRPIDQWKKA